MEARTEDRTESLHRRIETERMRFRTAAHDLARAARAEISIGEHAADRPWLWILGGVFLGLWIGAGNDSRVNGCS